MREYIGRIRITTVAGCVALVCFLAQPLSLYAQYDGLWRNATTENNVPRFYVNAGQVTNFYSSLRYSCGSSTYSGSATASSNVTIVGNYFAIDLVSGFASYTFEGYFTSSSMCTGRYSYFATGCGGGSFGSGNWATAKVGPDPVLSVSPATLSFGSVAAGSSSNRTFTVQNIGGGTLSGSASGLSVPFSLVSGSPYSLNSFASTSVVVQFSPGAANAYTQTVSFTGGSGASRTVVGTGTVANLAPTNILLSATNLAENLNAGAKIGYFTAQDPDAGNSFIYALTNGTGDADNSSFAVSGSNLLSAAVFNYEIKSNYSIRVQATDQGGLSTQKMFAVGIINIAEDPPAFSEPPYFSGSNHVLRWTSLTNHKYTLHYSTNLLSGFAVLQSNITATPTMNSFTDSVINTTQKYWKITTEP